MTTSMIEGAEGKSAEIQTENALTIRSKIEAISLTADRMPEEEKQPDFKWLIEVVVPEVSEDLQKTLAETTLIRCEADTSSGWCKYEFFGTTFLGAINGTVKFGASIISQSVKLRAVK